MSESTEDLTDRLAVALGHSRKDKKHRTLTRTALNDLADELNITFSEDVTAGELRALVREELDQEETPAADDTNAFVKSEKRQLLSKLHSSN